MLCAAGCISSTPDFRQVVSEAKAAVAPSVVFIRVIYNDTESGRNRKGVASGSGVIVSKDGEVLTNHHVVDKTSEIRCQLADGRSFTAKVLGKDKDLDIALLKLDMPEGTDIPVASLSPRRLEVGEVVLAMGAPWGLARSVSMGIVSCNDRFLEDCGDYTLWYQTDAAISPGNSGGPLVDTDGLVVGLNARGNLWGDQAFTIPSETILEILPDLRKYGEAHWAWFGFKLQPLEDFKRNIRFDAKEGALVADVEPGSPAEKAGLKSNDLLLSVDGEKTTARFWEDIPAIERHLGRREFEKPCKFKVVRDGRDVEIAVAPTEIPRNIVTIFISSFCAVFEILSVTPETVSRLPAIRKPISGAASGRISETTRVTTIGNATSSSFDTGRSDSILMARSFFVVRSLMNGG